MAPMLFHGVPIVFVIMAFALATILAQVKIELLRFFFHLSIKDGLTI